MLHIIKRGGIFMCKKINAELVIGNILIEAIERKQILLTIEQIIEFETKFDELLKKDDAFTDFNLSEISLFTQNYPFFLEIKDSESVEIQTSNDQIDIFTNRLKRYFRIGLPNNIVNDVKQTSELVFGR